MTLVTNQDEVCHSDLEIVKFFSKTKLFVHTRKDPDHLQILNTNRAHSNSIDGDSTDISQSSVGQWESLDGFTSGFLGL